MAFMELRALLVRVDEGCDETAAVGDHELESGGGCALVVAGAVVGVPDQHRRYRGVHARGHEEGHPILDLGVRDADVGDDSVANDRRDEGE